MLISRANLAVAAVASKKAQLPGINRVHLCEDGTTVAANEHMLLAVGPVKPEAAAAFPMVESGSTSPPPGGIGLPLELCRDALRNMPRADLEKQYARITRADEDAIGLMTTDGIKKDEVTGMPMRGKFPQWKMLLAGARAQATRGKIAVNGKKLIELLQTILQACPDKGDYNMIWMQFGGDGDAMYIRALNRQTGQYALGMVNPVDVGAHWIRTDAWEREVLGLGKRTVKKIGRTVKRVRR